MEGRLIVSNGPADRFAATAWYEGAMNIWYSTGYSTREEAEAAATYGPLSVWLFEPNAALLKAGAFRQVAQHYGLTKLHPNTHLYTAAEDRPDFPGRRFRVLGETTAQKKALKKLLPEPAAMVGTRNFPMGAPQLRAKLGLKEGGTHYVMGFTNHEDQKRLAILEPVLGE